MKRLFIAMVVSCVTFTITGSPVDMMVGARGYGLGGAYVALASDPSSVYWNPSRLSYIEHISLLESNWILQDVKGVNVNYIAFVVPIKYVGAIGVGWLLNHAKLEYGDFDSDNQVETFSKSANENIFSLSWGRQLVDELLFLKRPTVGFTLNRFSFNTENEDGAGLGFDAGISTEFPLGFSLGFTARNLGAEVMGYKLDPELRFGLGFSRLINSMHRITVGVDGAYLRNRDYESETGLEPAKNNMKAFGGLEYAIVLKDIEIAIRGGGNGLVLNNTTGNYSFAGGCGFTWLGYALDYAFMGATDRDAALGYGHRISLVLQLDKLVPGRSVAAD